MTYIWQEIGGLVHIEPDTRYVKSSLVVEEPLKFVGPPLLGIWVCPIRESSWSRPDDSLVDIPTIELHKDILLHTRLVGLVRFDRGVGSSAEYCWVNHDDEVSAGLLEGVDYVLNLIQGEPVGVKSLNPSLVHVVDILVVSLILLDR